MPNAFWPVDLPQEPYQDGPPSYTPQDNTIRTSTGSGPNKMRRRFTAVTEDVSIKMVITEQELATLFDFCKLTVAEVLPFTWVDFRTGLPATYRFKAGYSSIKQEWWAADYWTISIDLELLP